MTARMEVRDGNGVAFLTRRGVECKWFGVFVHRLDAPDPADSVHSHPWRFWSWVLRGGYTEERCRTDLACSIARYMAADGRRERGVARDRGWLSVRSMPLNKAHRIVSLRRSPTWTLVIRGRKASDTWGFFTPEGFRDEDSYERSGRR